MKLCFERKVLLKYYGTSIYAHVQWKIMIYYDTKVFWYRSDLCSQPNYVSVGSANGDYTLVLSDPASGGCALVFVDPASGGCTLVFSEPRQLGLNVGHSRGCWVTSVLNWIKFMIILYVNIWKDWICIKSAWNIFLCLFVALFLKII